jgi:hypothetical protein
MDDRDFFDLMLQGMKDTTHAEDSYWAVEEIKDETGFPEDPSEWRVYAQTADSQYEVAVFEHEAAAAFVAAIHGAFPDIWRRLHMALDEADEKDKAKDEAEHLAADLSRRLTECQRAYTKTEVSEEWHGIATGT